MSRAIPLLVIAAIFAVITIFAYASLTMQPSQTTNAPDIFSAQRSISYSNITATHVPSAKDISFLPACSCSHEISCGSATYCSGSCPSDCPPKRIACGFSDGKLIFGSECSAAPSPTNGASNSASSTSNGASNSASSTSNGASNSASNGASRSSNSASNAVSNAASGAATVITTTTSIPPGCGPLPNSIVSQIESSAPWYCPINEQVYDTWSSETPIAFAAILIAFSIAAIIFMVGAGLRNDRIRNFGLGELYEAIASAIIVGLFLYVSAVAFGIIPSLFVGTINPYATAFHLILSTIQQAEGVFSSLYNVVIMDSFYASINVELDLPISGAPPISLLTLLYALPLEALVIEPSIVLGTFIVEGITALYAEYYLLVFFSVASIPVFLVPGVIFRAIFPTRALGGMLIALAMGFYIVMPTMFAIAYYFTAPSILHTLSTASIQMNRFGQGSGAITNAITPDSPLVTQVGSVQSAMSSFWLLILFYPLLIIAVTYAFVTQIANFIGGASQMSGKMRTFI
ncbi:MAG: hypothetical protein ACP5MZ_00155 [Candidatus Micrarchaeia archaeon]